MPSDVTAAPEGEKPIEVLLVDDQALLVEAIISQLGNDGRVQIIAAAGSAGEAERMIARLDADVALIDMMLPDEPGEYLIKLLADRSPRTRCIALSADESSEMLLRAINAGAAGFLAKGSGTLECLIESVLNVIDGKLVFPSGRLRALVPELAQTPPDSSLELDDADRRLIALIADQANDEELARQLGQDAQGAHEKLVDLCHRMGVSSPLQAVAAAGSQVEVT